MNKKKAPKVKKENDVKKGFANKPRVKKPKTVLKAKIQEKPKEEGKKHAEKIVEPARQQQAAQYIPSGREEFPDFYNETRIVLLSRDPYWLFCYWEVSQGSIEEMKRKAGGEFAGSRTILRIYDVTEINFNGRNAHKYFDITLEGMVRSWYIHVGEPERSWMVDIGVLTPSGKFYLFARSNAAKTPPEKISNIYDEEWMISEEEMRKMYWHDDLKKGIGSEFLSRVLYKRLKEELSSGGVSSLSSPSMKKEGPSLFWLRVGTELVVFGATDPSAKLTINSSPVKLAEDGTFSLRFGLVDGRHTINIEAASKDKVYKKAINILVEQNTVKEL